MSVLGLRCDSSGIRLSCRPDPARPPQPLDALCSLELPATVPVSTEVNATGTLPVEELFRRCFTHPGARSTPTPAWLPEAVTAWFRALVAAIDGNPDLNVLLLGGVEQFAVVAPAGAQPAQVEAFRGAAGKAGRPVTVVLDPVAAFAWATRAFEPLRPFLLCEWEDDLVCRTVIAYDTLHHLSTVGEPLRRRGLGSATWVDRLAHAVQGKLAPGAAPVPAGHVRRHAAAGFEQMLHTGTVELPAQPAPTPIAGSPAPSTTTSNPPPAPLPALPGLSSTEVAGAWATPRHLATNFATAAARAACGCGAGTAVLSGPLFNLPLLEEDARTGLRAGGMREIVSTRGEAALLGVHYCVHPRPRLPYDCGFLLRRPGSPRGIGTLVLVRPAALGEERQSEEFELPLPPAASLEIAFYLRRLDETQRAVLCEVMRSHVFAPALNNSGHARVRVAMKVEADSSHQPTVTVDVHDLNSQEHIRFERLPVTGGMPLEASPLRDPRELPAVDWAPKIDTARVSGPGGTPPDTVRKWRDALEGRGIKPPRAAYAAYLVNTVVSLFNATAAVGGCSFTDLAAGLKTWLNVESQVEARAPEDFQSEGRRILYEAMRRCAQALANQGGTHCRAWLRKHPAAGAGPVSAKCAPEFVNSVSQDRAGQPDPGDLADVLDQVQRVFHLASEPPHSLNVDW